MAASETFPPAGTAPDGVVEMFGVNLDTVKGSAPHSELTGLLLASPLYVATQLYVPGPPTVTLPDEALPPTSVPLVVAVGVVQVVSPGAYSVKTTVPAGENPPVSVAWSETVPPAGTEPDGVVEMDAAASATATVSLPQGDATGLLSVSPLYVATQLYVPTAPTVMSPDVAVPAVR